jgi:predicted transport protein
MAKSPDEQAESMIANLKPNTGRSLEEWQTLMRENSNLKHGEVVALLKSKHGVTHGYANLIAHKLKQSDAGSSADDDLIASQYSGAKAALKPIYDSIMKAVHALGSDVEVSPKKAYVSLRRSKQFALVQPSTASRMDVGLVLKGVAPVGRLEASGSWNAMVTHRVRVENLAQVDTQLISWLKQAYQSA